MSTCEDCEYPCGPGGCECPEECPARQTEPAAPTGPDPRTDAAVER